MRSNRAQNTLLYLGMAAVIVAFAFPVLWVFSLSLRTAAEISAVPPPLVPEVPQWGNYGRVLETTNIGRYLLNSLIVVAGSVIGCLAVCIPAAYGMSRLRFRGERTFSRFVLACQLISPVVLVVPIYRVFVSLDLVNNYLGLILVYVAVTSPFLTWFLRDYLDTVPAQLDEAAMMDGCTRWQALLWIVLPTAAPGIASAAIVVSVLSWSQFAVPFVLLDDSNLYPVSVGVVNLQQTGNEITTQYLAAGSILAVVPVIVVFIVLQRYIVGALTAGSLKG
ncbi:carbohydrate ABC transporter permease [Pseudonocardia spinosispora]|uniref:carbohydrate ABC transporter permease n=1 Tax=Pseudonocardia spinosispora TaxID=103441 RepID=UPI0004002B1F|nr:carbohydrate ABC transporter permease [Pseudonocardia spinosispora]